MRYYVRFLESSNAVTPNPRESPVTKPSFHSFCTIFKTWYFQFILMEFPLVVVVFPFSGGVPQVPYNALESECSMKG